MIASGHLVASRPFTVSEQKLAAPVRILMAARCAGPSGAGLFGTGGDATGNALHTLFGTKPKPDAGNAVPLHRAINSVK